MKTLDVNLLCSHTGTHTHTYTNVCHMLVHIQMNALQYCLTVHSNSHTPEAAGDCQAVYQSSPPCASEPPPGEVHRAPSAPWPSVPAQELHHPQVGRDDQEEGVLEVSEEWEGEGQE